MSSLLRIVFDPDTTAPSIPSILSVTAVGQSRLDIAWTTSTDVSGIAGYELLKDGTTVIALGVQTSYSDTQLAAASTHTYRVRARDGANNLSGYSVQAQGTTAAAPPGYNPTYPRLGTYPIGGTQLPAAAELARRHVNVLAHYPGWQQSKGTSLATLTAAAKALSTIGTKVFAYVIYTEIPDTQATAGQANWEIWQHANNNNLWAYQNGLTETTRVASHEAGWSKLNYTSNGKLVDGKNFVQWCIDWSTRLNRDGGTFSNGLNSLTASANGSLDGLFFDNVFYRERAPLADYNRDGTLDVLATSQNYIQQSHADAIVYYRSIWPTSPILVNSADWSFYGTSFAGAPMDQRAEGGVIEHAEVFETTFASVMQNIKVQMDAYIAPKLGILEVDIVSLTNYALMRYWLGISLLTDTYYYPHAGSGLLAQELSSAWYDEFGFNLGAATEPVQTAARYSAGSSGEGVWRRDFANGIVLVAAKRANASTTAYASVALGGTFYRLIGTQAPTVNSGALVTTVTLSPRDAVILSRTPLDTTAPTVPASLSATAVSSSTINLTWNASTDSGGSGLAGYRLERSPNGSTGWTQIAQQTTTTYSDTGRAASTQYFYRVRAYDNAGNQSAFTNTANATTQASPTNPGNLFVANFSSPGASTMYNFAGGYSTGSNWTKTHEASGGPGGIPCVNVTWLGSANQYNYGWWMPTLGHVFTAGETIYFRMIRRYHDNMRWNGGARHKILILGENDSRCIVYGNYPSPSAGGALGWRDSGGGGAFYPHAIPSNFGLSGASDWSGFSGIYGSTKVGKNITIDCAGPALMTYGSNPNPPIPGPNSAAPTAGNCWYYEQYAITAGSAGTHAFRVWINNNDFANPTVVQTIDVKTEVVGTTNWHVTPNVGAYLDTTPVASSGFRMAGCIAATNFDPSHYPG